MSTADPLIDGDSHYNEPAHCFSEYIDPLFRDDAIVVTDAESGRETIRWREQPLELIPQGFFVRQLHPGALRAMMRALKAGLTAEEAGIYGPIKPEYRDRDARLCYLDACGVEATLLFPTLGILWEHHLRHDTRALYANLRAFNRWLSEEWGYDFEHRLIAAPMLSLHDPGLAVAELEWVLERGARVACLKPGHANHRSLADPVFDAFWARVEEADLVIAFHIGESGYNEFYSVDFGEDPTPLPHSKSALQWSLFYGDRPIMDTFASLILHNIFGRFPKLRFLSVENGSLWVRYLLANMDKMKGMGRSGPWLGGRVEGRPSDLFKQHVWVSPYPEDDVAALIDVIGPARVVMGSDFPHPEGAESVTALAQRNEHLGPERYRLFTHDNASALLNNASST